MSTNVSYYGFSFKEVGEIVTKMASVLTNESEAAINAACLAMVVHNNKPEYNAERVVGAVKAISEWIALYLSEPEIGKAN